MLVRTRCMFRDSTANAWSAHPIHNSFMSIMDHITTRHRMRHTILKQKSFKINKSSNLSSCGQFHELSRQPKSDHLTEQMLMSRLNFLMPAWPWLIYLLVGLEWQKSNKGFPSRRKGMRGASIRYHNAPTHTDRPTIPQLDRSIKLDQITLKYSSKLIEGHVAIKLPERKFSVSANSNAAWLTTSGSDQTRTRSLMSTLDSWPNNHKYRHIKGLRTWSTR